MNNLFDFYSFYILLLQPILHQGDVDAGDFEGLWGVGGYLGLPGT